MNSFGVTNPGETCSTSPVGETSSVVGKPRTPSFCTSSALSRVWAITVSVRASSIRSTDGVRVGLLQHLVAVDAAIGREHHQQRLLLLDGLLPGRLYGAVPEQGTPVAGRVGGEAGTGDKRDKEQPQDKVSAVAHRIPQMC